MVLAGFKLELHKGDERNEEGCLFVHTGDSEKGFLAAHSLIASVCKSGVSKQINLGLITPSPANYFTDLR